MTAKFNFKTISEPFEADWPVHVRVPVDGGKIETQTFSVRFRSFSPDESKAQDEAEKEAGAKGGHIDRKDVLRKVIVDLGKEEGESLTPELLEDFLATPHVYMALLRAHTSFQLGAPEKN